jgi:hypothetical protein
MSLIADDGDPVKESEGYAFLSLPKADHLYDLSSRASAREVAVATD